MQKSSELLEIEELICLLMMFDMVMVCLKRNEGKNCMLYLLFKQPCTLEMITILKEFTNEKLVRIWKV